MELEEFMRRWIGRTILVALLPFGSLSAQSQPEAVAIIFDNGPMNYASGHEVVHWTVADDFTPPGPENATRLEIGLLDTTCDGLLEWDGQVRWWIYADSGGPNPLPVGVVATGFAPEVTVILDAGHSACPGGWSWYDVWFPLGQSVDLTPGARYWVGLHLGHDWPAATVGPYWAHTDDVGAQLESFVRSEWGTGPWNSGGFHLSFVLEANSYDTWIFYDGFESGDTSIWSWAPDATPGRFPVGGHCSPISAW